MGGATGGTGGASSAGSGGKGGSGGTSGSGGSGGAVILFTPASASCAAGNVNEAFTVCRTCHSSPPNGAPVGLVTFAQITFQKSNIIDKLNNNAMPPPSSGLMIMPAHKSLILNWLNAGGIGVPNASCP
jgi:hypothetical protein